MIAAVAALPLLFAGERGLLHLPSADEVRTQPISRTGNEAGWPSAVDSGVLTCVWSAGERVTLFFEATARDGGDDDAQRDGACCQ